MKGNKNNANDTSGNKVEDKGNNNDSSLAIMKTIAKTKTTVHLAVMTTIARKVMRQRRKESAMVRERK